MRYKIDEIVQLIMDYRGKTPKKLGMNWTENQKDIIALSAKNIKDNKIVNTDKSHYGSELLYKHWMKDGDIEPGDILMTSEAPLGEVYLVSKPIKAILSQRLFLLRFNKNIVNPWYMYAFMNSQSFKNQLLLRATGTTVVGIKQKDLRKIEVELPSRELQNKIGSIFQFLYKKIHINGRINDNLTFQNILLSNSFFRFLSILFSFSFLLISLNIASAELSKYLAFAFEGILTMWALSLVPDISLNVDPLASLIIKGVSFFNNSYINSGEYPLLGMIDLNP